MENFFFFLILFLQCKCIHVLLLWGKSHWNILSGNFGHVPVFTNKNVFGRHFVTVYILSYTVSHGKFHDRAAPGNFKAPGQPGARPVTPTIGTGMVRVPYQKSKNTKSTKIPTNGKKRIPPCAQTGEKSRMFYHITWICFYSILYDICETLISILQKNCNILPSLYAGTFDKTA